MPVSKEPSGTALKSEAKQVEAKTKVRAERIGDLLKQTRLARGEDLYQIAEYLRIKAAFLVALENSNFDAFAADAYVIGFLRTYATFLGIDGKDAVDRYRYEMAGSRKKPVLSMPQPMTEGRAPSGIIIVGATIAIFLIYALWYMMSSGNRTGVTTEPALPSAQQIAPPTTDKGAAAGLTAPVVDVPAVPASLPEKTISAAIPQPADITLAGAPPQLGIASVKDDAPMPKSVDKVLDTKSAASAPATPEASQDAADAKKDAHDGKKQIYGDPNEVSHIVIRATQSSWVMVTDESGKAIFDHVLKPGDTYKVPNKAGLSLTTGNGSGIILSLNGTDLPKIATGAPHVVRDIPLDPDRLAPEHSTDEPSPQ